MNVFPVTRYVAEDGTEFATEQAALAYVGLAAKVQAIMAPLPPRPAGFPHNAYIQHERSAITLAWNQLLEVAASQLGPHDWFVQSRDLQADASWAGRLIGEIDGVVLWREGWFRMSCLDRKTLREYEQPYHAAHPDEVLDAYALQ